MFILILQIFCPHVLYGGVCARGCVCCMFVQFSACGGYGILLLFNCVFSLSSPEVSNIKGNSLGL